MSPLHPPSKTASILKQTLLVWLALMALEGGAQLSEAKCAFKGIFNFGDSNSDTGGFYAAFPAQSPPFGMTYFKKPVGRATDGRLIIDFLAQALGLPFLSPYLKSIGSDFRHGANFATSASTVLLPTASLFVSGISPFSLAIQLNQIKQFKVEVDQGHSTHSKSIGSRLPSPSIFGKSLYTFYIGQNDFTSDLASLGINGVKGFLPQVVSQIAYTIKDLYGKGGRTFLVLNLAPIGCYPSFLVQLPHNSSDIDEFGCLISYNNAVADYNTMLKEALANIRPDLPKASVVYVDTHAVLLELFQHPTSHGTSKNYSLAFSCQILRALYISERFKILPNFVIDVFYYLLPGLKYGTKACCGYGGGAYNINLQVYCGNSNVINGSTVTATACSDPQNYVSWDGIHATEAANKLTAYAILNGSYSDPPFALHEFCDIQPIG